MSTFIETLRREAQALAQQVATLRPQRAALATAAAAAEDRYQDALASVTHGVPSPGADEAHRVLQDARGRLARCESDLANVEARHADLYRLLSADASTDAVKQAVAAGAAGVAAVEQRIVENVDDIAAVSGLRDEERALAGAARAGATAAAVSSLPERVRGLLGIKPADTTAPTTDPTVHDAKAAALGDALVKLEDIGAALQADLAAAQGTHAGAVQSQLQSAAAVAELQHAEALASYLQTLAQFQRAHLEAFDMLPSMPDYARHAEDIRSETTRAVSDEAPPDESPLRRGLKRLASAAGF